MAGPNDSRIAKARKHTDVNGTHEEGLLWNGPIPDPGTLREYESLLPGMAETIVNMSKQEQNFRHKNTEDNDLTMRKAIRMDSITRLMIPIFSFIVSISVIALAYVAFSKNLEWAGSILSVSSIGAIIYSYSKMMSTRITSSEEPKKKPRN